MRMTDAAIGDAGARERAVALENSVLVQAPAGSGKTTLLTQRYLRLLAGAAIPENILALTFTRRAALEMRERVARALEAARAPAAPADLDTRTWELAVAAVRHLDSVGIDLAAHPARMRIETIDAFNAWLAAQLPVTARTGARFATVEDAGSLYREAARRALAYEAPDAFGAAVESVLALGDQRWSSLAARIAQMLASRDHWLPLIAGGLETSSGLDAAASRQLRARFDADLSFVVARALADAVAVLGGERLAALSRLVASLAARLGAARPDLAPWRADASPLRAEPRDIPRWRGVLGLVLLKGGAIRARLTKAEGFAPGSADKALMQDLLVELARDPRVRVALADVAALPEPRYGDREWERVRDVAQVLMLAAAMLEGVFREAGAVDFTAVAIAARRALGGAQEPTDLALRLDYRLQHVLVDEFQDTSATQLALLRVLTAGWQDGDGRSLFCVGDPMQSIYRFRQAEVRGFLALAERGLGDLRFAVQRLSSNFRTGPELVAWVNATFSRILPAVDDGERGAIAFRAGVAARHAPPATSVGVSFARHASPHAEAGAIAALIAARREEHPHWRIAVLVRAKSHAQAIGAQLRERGIAFAALDIEPLQDRAAVRDLLCLARALLHWGDRSAWLALLRAPWCGLVLADLLRVARGAPLVWDALQDAATQAELSGDGQARAGRLRAVLGAAFATPKPDSFVRWLERTWLALGGPACVAGARDLEHVRAAFARLRTLEQAGLPDPAEVDAAFTNLFARDDAVGAVEIMTIHKAKGLEFDLVVLPALERGISSRSDEFLLSQQFPRGDGVGEGLVMAARAAVGEDESALFAYLRQQQAHAAQLEAERLLYVACTRAKWQLHLSACTGRAEDGHIYKPRAGSLLSLLWPVVAADFDAAAMPAPADAGDGADPSEPMGARGGPLQRVPAGWQPAPRPAPFVLARDPIALAPASATPPFDWAGETARQVGSLVHAELQSLDVVDVTSAEIRARTGQFQRWLRLRGVPPERAAHGAERVVLALIAVQEDPRGRWILARHPRDDAREQAWSGLWQGELEHVVFDRSFVDDAGTRWVIDYKTSEHQGGGAQEFLDREVARYAPTMGKYAAFAARLGPEPVRLGLYFPLMRAWREWSP
jgi:ATP-dependent exoDNAse (exonuclease V) beta subunit